MSPATRALTAALGPALVLALTACGGDDTPRAAAQSPSATTSAEPAAEVPAGPKVAEPTVAPLQIDDSASDVYGGQEMVETAYGEVVDLVTDLGLDPDFYLLDGDNTADDLAPLMARLTSEQAAFLRTQADGCLAA